MNTLHLLPIFWSGCIYILLTKIIKTNSKLQNISKWYFQTGSLIFHIKAPWEITNTNRFDSYRIHLSVLSFVINRAICLGLFSFVKFALCCSRSFMCLEVSLPYSLVRIRSCGLTRIMTNTGSRAVRELPLHDLTILCSTNLNWHLLKTKYHYKPKTNFLDYSSINESTKIYLPPSKFEIFWFQSNKKKAQLQLKVSKLILTILDAIRESNLR